MAQQTDPNLTEHERQLLAEVAAAYGLGALSDPLASRDAWGDRIQIAFSAGRRRLLLKEWPDYCRKDDDIDFSLAVQDTARAGGVETLRLTDGGRTFDWGRRRFILSAFVGEAFDPARPGQIPAMAGMLGRFHRSVADANLPGSSWGVGRISACTRRWRP